MESIIGVLLTVGVTFLYLVGITYFAYKSLEQEDYWSMALFIVLPPLLSGIILTLWN